MTSSERDSVSTEQASVEETSAWLAMRGVQPADIEFMSLQLTGWSLAEMDAMYEALHGSTA